MFFFIFKISLFYIILIYLVDQLIDFFKQNLTIPKTKDLINLTPKKYEEILNTIKQNNHTNISDKITNIENLPILHNEEKDDTMKEELKSFLKKQLLTQKNNLSSLHNFEDENNTTSINFSSII